MVGGCGLDRCECGVDGFELCLLSLRERCFIKIILKYKVILVNR